MASISKAARELAGRLNANKVLESMPKICYLDCGGKVRVGRSDWPGDVFNVVEKRDFVIFKRVIDALSYPIHNWEEDEA